MTNKIKSVRESKGITQLELARITRIAPTNLSSIETGKQYAYPGWRKRIAAALEVSEKELFGEGA